MGVFSKYTFFCEFFGDSLYWKTNDQKEKITHYLVSYILCNFIAHFGLTVDVS